MNRLNKSYLILLFSTIVTAYAFTLRDISPLTYILFPLVLIAEISFLLLTYFQEMIPPVEISLLEGAGWSLDPNMESLELGGNQVYYLRGEETIYGERIGSAVKVLMYWDGSGLLWRNEEIETHVIALVLDTHTHTHIQSTDTHIPLDAKNPPNTDGLDGRTLSKNIKEQKEKKERIQKKSSGFVGWLEDLKADNEAKLRHRRSLMAEAEELRKKREEHEKWRRS